MEWQKDDGCLTPAEAKRGFPKTQTDPAPVWQRHGLGSKSLHAQDTPLTAPEMFTLIELDQQQLDGIVQTVQGGAKNVQDIYPLTPLQEGLLFHHLLNKQSDTYVLSTLLELQSRAQLDALIDALEAVIARHDILRTAILWEQLPRPVHVVYRQVRLPVEELVLDRDREPIEQLGECMMSQPQQWDLRQAPLVRLRVASDSTGARWYALLQLHHVICDYGSLRTVVAETIAHIEGRADTLLAPAVYRDHVAQVLASARTPDAESFFRSKLGEIDEPTAPFGLVDVHGDGARIEEARQVLEPTLAQRLRSQGSCLRVSVARLFHAAWGLVVARTSGRDDVVFGTVLLASWQRSARAQRVLGMSINTLPLRLQLAGITAGELVQQTQRELAELLNYEQASLALAQRCSGIAGSAPLFSTLLNFRHAAPESQAEWVGAGGIRVLAAPEARTNYPIVLTVDDLGESFALTAQTDGRIDPHRMLGYVCTAMQSLVDALERAPQTPALALPVVPQSERRQVLEVFNATQALYPQEKLIHELFEEQVERTPDAIAVVYEGQSLTYGELNGRANQLARYLRNLRSQAVATGDYIPILMARSVEMLVAQLAVLKSGGVYVPVDPELPAERQAFMIRDCGARLILADGEKCSDVSTGQAQWIDCSTVKEVVESESASNLKLPMDPVPAAYVMYTSGSTGVPKGVIVPHHAVNRLAINNGYARIEPDDCIAHYSNPTFDASTFEIWGALLNGARVVIVPQSVVLETERFAEVLRQQRVTALYMSVGLFNQYTEALADVFMRLRYLMVGGDALEPGAIRQVLRNSPPQRLLNVYGPTECTTFSTKYLIETVEEEAKSIPIGQPIANAQIYILDSHRQALPIGVTGEIYIGGAGVACGYLNRPDLTAERFLSDSFSIDPQARLYKTGDLGRWRADGAIEFLGRNDHQVKIRGFRVEPGEIETQLARHAQVKEATVLARGDGVGEKRLVAYVVPRDSSSVPGIEELRAYLQGVLPEYMVPSAFVTLERMPLTATGKVNRRALPAPELGAYASRQYEAPRGDVEEALARIWQELLQLERIGRHDDFFELGGHSLLAMRVIVRVRQSLGVQTTPRMLFATPSLAGFAKNVETLIWLKESSSNRASLGERSYSEEGVI